VRKVAGMFDVPLAAKLSERFTVELPELDEEWSVGAIVGPSGSGKSTVARAAYGARLYQAGEWPAEKAIVDCFGDIDMRELTQWLTSVGFSSPPAWCKPYAVLSNGEKFRCDLARALVAGEKIVAFDEFTSVVDRTVAKIGSAAVAKAVRKSTKQFVAVTCHYDVLEWLECDWVLDMASGQLARRRLRRPKIALHVHQASPACWPLFAKHHYLSAKLGGGKCWVGLVEGELAAFCSIGPIVGYRGKRRIGRLVTLPDYQGVGIGTALLECCAAMVASEGHEVRLVTGHPAMIAYAQRSPKWRIVSVKTSGNARPNMSVDANRRDLVATSAGRSVISAIYL
jgi:ABC-type dipeptide/oligopeptide/nickel transport system ATPase subunit